MQITARTRLLDKRTAWGDNQSLTFGADYADGRNEAWAAATPALTVQMTVRGDVAAHFEAGQPYTLTFEKTPEEDPG